MAAYLYCPVWVQVVTVKLNQSYSACGVGQTPTTDVPCEPGVTLTQGNGTSVSNPASHVLVCPPAACSTIQDPIQWRAACERHIMALVYDIRAICQVHCAHTSLEDLRRCMTAAIAMK
jgi:hypothetical protein